MSVAPLKRLSEVTPGRVAVENMSTFLYFAYGSNMSHRRLVARTSSAALLGAATARRHRLVFDKRSLDGSAKADCLPTEQDADVVHGALFRVDESELELLDKAEGAGSGYDRRAIEVASGGCTESATTYIATRKQNNLAPYGWYLVHVLIGANEAGLLPSYMSAIRDVPWTQDLDHSREQRELKIYSAEELAEVWRFLRGPNGGAV